MPATQRTSLQGIDGSRVDIYQWLSDQIAAADTDVPDFYFRIQTVIEAVDVSKATVLRALAWLSDNQHIDYEPGNRARMSRVRLISAPRHGEEA